MVDIVGGAVVVDCVVLVFSGVVFVEGWGSCKLCNSGSWLCASTRIYIYIYTYIYVYIYIHTHIYIYII